MDYKNIDSVGGQSNKHKVISTGYGTVCDLCAFLGDNV